METSGENENCVRNLDNLLPEELASELAKRAEEVERMLDDLENAKRVPASVMQIEFTI